MESRINSKTVENAALFETDSEAKTLQDDAEAVIRSEEGANVGTSQKNPALIGALEISALLKQMEDLRSAIPNQELKKSTDLIEIESLLSNGMADLNELHANVQRWTNKIAQLKLRTKQAGEHWESLKNDKKDV